MLERPGIRDRTVLEKGLSRVKGNFTHGSEGGDQASTLLDPVSSPAMALWPEFGLMDRLQEPEHEEWRRLTRRRHGGRFNILFCDGHVENLKPASLFDVRQDAVLRRWHRDDLPHREELPELQ